jgi:two-component system, NtrC family, response regulator HydG
MEALPTILVVDDEEVIRDSCRQTLERSHYRVETAKNGIEALRALQQKAVDLVILDLKMPGLDGMEFLRRVRSDSPDLDVVVITGYSSVGSVVECMRLGAYDYLPKPFDAESLRLVVARAIEKRLLALENRALRQQLRDESAPDLLLGESPAILRVHELVQRVGQTEATVLILGESGTGKELVARAIHRAGQRREKPFLTVDCGALVESLFESELFGHVKGSFTGATSTRIGRFEMAQGGTIFLDEIGNISPAIQAKLLRVIQEREITKIGGSEPIKVDVRILAATNQDLQSAIGEGRFREDLYYRLGVVMIEIPPLRARREDIPVLAAGLLKRLSERKLLAQKALSPEALKRLQGYDWPGNVRELENTLERAMVLAEGPMIGPDDLTFMDSQTGPLPAGDENQELRLESIEARHIRRVLDLTGWRLSRAAVLMGIDRKTLWRKIKALKLREPL